MIPDCLLKKRHRHCCCTRNTNDWGRFGGSHASTLVDECGECRHRWMIGDRAETQLDPECRIDLGRDNRAAQGVAAEVEEIVVPADIRQFKNLRPNIGKQHLRFRSRLITLVAVANRKGNTGGAPLDQSCYLCCRGDFPKTRFSTAPCGGADLLSRHASGVAPSTTHRSS